MRDNTVWAVISLLFGLWNGYSAVMSYANGNLTWALIDAALAVLMFFYFFRAWQAR